jgi:hypothetical protein
MRSSLQFLFSGDSPRGGQWWGLLRDAAQAENLKAVLDDILGHGNDTCLLPGQLEAGVCQSQ